GYADKDAVIISGIAHDDNMGDQIRVTVVATGLGRKKPEIVVDNTEQHHLRTGTDDASAAVDGLRGSIGGFNPIRAARGPRTGHLNAGFGLSSGGVTDSAISRRSLSDDERNDSDVPAFLRKQAN